MVALYLPWCKYLAAQERVEMIMMRRMRKRKRRKMRNRPGGRERHQTLMLLRKRLSRSRLLMPRSKQALSRRLQVPAPTKKNLLNGETLWSVFQDGLNETRENACM